MQIRYTIGTYRADDWICTSICRFTKPVPSAIEPRRRTSTSARSRTPWSSFGGCRLSQEHTRVRLRITVMGSQGIRRELNPYLLVHSQACSDRYTTDTI